MQNVTISRCFVTFCKQRQINEQRIITHAYTAIVLVAVALIPNKRPNNEQQNTRKKTLKVRPNKKAADSAENISAMKQNQTNHNDAPAISSKEVSRRSLELSTHRPRTIRVRGLTLVRRPIWRIHSLTLITFHEPGPDMRR